MQYSIKPYIYNLDKHLSLFFTEIHQMSFSMIEDGIKSCELVISGEYPEMSWGLEISELLIHKETSILEYNSSFVAEIPTIEIYNMLKKYRDKLKEYEEDNKIQA